MLYYWNMNNIHSSSRHCLLINRYTYSPRHKFTSVTSYYNIHTCHDSIEKRYNVTITSDIIPLCKDMMTIHIIICPPPCPLHTDSHKHTLRKPSRNLEERDEWSNMTISLISNQKFNWHSVRMVLFGLFHLFASS